MRWTICLLVAFAAACAHTPEERAAREAERERRLAAREESRRRTVEMIEADEQMVSGCDFLGTVEGSSGWGGTMAGGAGMSRAMRDAIARAAKKGATHYIRGDANSGGWGSKATVRAYYCQPSEPASAAPPPPAPAE